jgi:hypothetical protein
VGEIKLFHTYAVVWQVSSNLFGALFHFIHPVNIVTGSVEGLNLNPTESKNLLE